VTQSRSVRSSGLSSDSTGFEVRPRSCST
jgi:hypothetical protein